MNDTLDGPIQALFERIAGPAAAQTPDLTAIGGALVELAGDLDYLRLWIERIGPDGGSLPIHTPARGPRLMIVHRPEGGMSAVHDHSTWVAITAISGLETHRRYRRPGDDTTALPELAETLSLEPPAVATLLPPDDIHDHGHLAGHGQPAYVLIMTGDDQRLFTRNEWDLATGQHRILGVGEGGRWLVGEDAGVRPAHRGS